MTHTIRTRSTRGAIRAEVVVLSALLGIVALFVFTYQRSIARRERLLRNVRDIQVLLVSARQSAMKGRLPVVVQFDLKQRRIVAWADVVPNLIRDHAEAPLLEFRIPPEVFLRYVPGGEVDGPGAVCFDGYGGNPALADRVVFGADGRLVPPEMPECRAPRVPRRLSASVPAGSIDCNPGNLCRGIYLSDSDAVQSPRQNAFRVSVDDPGQAGAVTILKWLPRSEGGNPGETNYVPPPWKWTDG